MNLDIQNVFSKIKNYECIQNEFEINMRIQIEITNLKKNYNENHKL